MKVILYFAAGLATTLASSLRPRQEKIPDPAPDSAYLTPEITEFTGP